MRVRISAQSLHKAGSAPEENDDAFAFTTTAGGARLAVADGATESAFSGEWATALVQAWTESDYRRIEPSLLEQSLGQWRSTIPEAGALPWYGQAKLAQGSHATLACVRLLRRRSGWRWTADVVGDSEVLVFASRHRLRCRRRFPFDKSASFGYHPQLVTTDPRSWAGLSVERFTGTASAPFELWVASDALAQSLLAADEHGRPNWDAWADAVEDGSAFGAQVVAMRTSGAMRNDDVTLVRVKAW